VLALRTAQGGHRLVHQRPHHLQAGPHSDGQSLSCVPSTSTLPLLGRS
jgi:hypothetical protein